MTTSAAVPSPATSHRRRRYGRRTRLGPAAAGTAMAHIFPPFPVRGIGADPEAAGQRYRAGPEASVPRPADHRCMTTSTLQLHIGRTRRLAVITAACVCSVLGV